MPWSFGSSDTVAMNTGIQTSLSGPALSPLECTCIEFALLSQVYRVRVTAPKTHTLRKLARENRGEDAMRRTIASVYLLVFLAAV